MEQNGFTVRTVNETDLDDWLRLRMRLWDATSEHDHKTEMMEIFSQRDSQVILVAESGGRLVGFLEASIRPFVEDCHSEHVGYLEGWFVEPDFRGRGVGTQLVRTAENWARQRGCTEMASDAEIGNEISLAAHTALGYEETSRLVHLRKELD